MRMAVIMRDEPHFSAGEGAPTLKGPPKDGNRIVDLPVPGGLLNSEHFLEFAILLGWRHARSGRPFSPSAGDGRPTRRSRWRAFRRGRIRPREAPTADPQSCPETLTTPPPL